MNKSYLKVLIVLSVLGMTLFISCDNESRTGLIGVYYNRIDLTYPKGIMMLDKLSQHWDENEDFKEGSGAVWQGYLESPYAGELSLQLATTKHTILRISELEMEARNNTVTREMEMKKGKKYPIEIIFLNEKNGSKTGAFEVKWSWGDEGFTLIENEYLSYTAKEEVELAWMSDLDKSNFEAANYLRAVNASHYIVYYEKGGFGAWPANNGIWSWGDEILVSFSKGYYKNKPYQHSYDATRPSRRVFARSMDGGETWNLEEETDVYPGKTRQLQEMQEAISFTDPGFTFTSNGNRFNYSYDNGRSWATPHIYPDFNKDFAGHSARTDYIVLDENTCRIFIASQYVGEKGWAQDMAYMVETRDGGKTMEFVSWIAETDTVRSVMPSTVMLTTDHMITALRRRYNAPKHVNHSLRDNWIDVYETRDGGRSWQFLSKIAETDRGRRNGNPPSLVRLGDGTLCVAYGYRGIPHSIRAHTSRDNGKTWSKEIIVRDDAVKWDMGYVRMVVRPDDKVAMVYYYATEEREEQHIECTIWDPMEVAPY
jgi:hypothetical protein